jgi:BlaI family penicillinase repressor
MKIMKPIPQISESELEVMKVVWRLGQAGSSQIIKELTETTEWKPKTIQTLITRLVEKGAIKAEKSTTTGTKAFVYSPLVDEAEFKARASESFLQKMYNGSVNLMLASFVKQQKLTKKDFDELKKLLKDDNAEA